MTDAEGLSFAHDIQPLFRERDRDAMTSHFDLWSYDDVRANAQHIYDQLDEGTMPCDRAWPHADVERMRSWIDSGALP